MTDVNSSLGSPWCLKDLEKHDGSYECCEINVYRVQICIVLFSYMCKEYKNLQDIKVFCYDNNGNFLMSM